MDVLTKAYPTIPLSGHSELLIWYLKVFKFHEAAKIYEFN